MDEIEKQVYLLEKSNQEITSNTHSDIILKSNNENILKELRQEKSKLVIDTNALRHVKSSTARSSATIECEILHNVKIILTTLSLSGIELLDKMEFTYSHLIVDEAWQSTEISTLIPFTHKIKNVVLVGDQNQLPSTVFSSDAEKTLFNRSLYERFLDNKIETFLLTIQYRMWKEIREFPSNQFYRGELTDDESILTRNVNDHDGWIPRLMFYDLSYTSEDKTSNNEKSKSNKLEAEFVSKLFIEAIYQKGDGDFYKGLAYVKRDVGIITPYKRQSKVIRELIEKSIQSEMKKKSTLYNEEIKNFDVNKYLEVNTVDSYQGREKDTIIISLVRSSKGKTSLIIFRFKSRNWIP